MRHDVAFPVGFVLGGNVDFSRSGAIDARQFGEFAFRIRFNPLVPARKGLPDQLLVASPEFVHLMRTCPAVPDVSGSRERWVQRRSHTPAVCGIHGQDFLRSVTFNQIEAHGPAVLDAEVIASVAGDTDAPTAHAVKCPRSSTVDVRTGSREAKCADGIHRRTVPGRTP